MGEINLRDFKVKTLEVKQRENQNVYFLFIDEKGNTVEVDMKKEKVYDRVILNR